MKRTGFTLPGALLCLVGLAAAAVAQSAGAPAARETVEETVQDIETMRLVLVRVLKESVGTYVADHAPAEEGAARRGSFGAGGGEPAGSFGAGLGAYVMATGGRYPYSWQQVTSNTRAFYAEGVGAIFSTELTIPRRAVDEDAEDADRDLWREAEAERRGDVGWTGGAGRTALALAGGSRKDAQRYALDERAVMAAVDAVVGALGDYGANIGGLGDDDVIIVAMRLAAGQVIGEGEAADDGGTGRAGRVFYSMTFDGREGAGASAIVRLAVADVRQYAAGRYDAETLRERAVVTRY